MGGGGWGEGGGTFDLIENFRPKNTNKNIFKITFIANDYNLTSYKVYASTSKHK